MHAIQPVIPGSGASLVRLPSPESPFKGVISTSAKDSVPDWPPAMGAPSGAPNIVLILLDDIGFADTGTFGGMAYTPELDRLAAQGLRYNNFHTTGLCSPTRAALLTGRNHHAVGFGGLANRASGFPGYNSLWRRSTVSIADVLRCAGYATAAFGKWHNTPIWEINPVGPFDRWPTRLGFEYFYGFNSGAENHWEPVSLYRNTTPIEARITPEQGYHLTTDITDEAIGWLKMFQSLSPEKPYFLYFATGAVHSPHHAPKEWIEKYRSKFDRGWDALNEEIFARQKRLGVVPVNTALTLRPREIPAWDAISDDQKRLYARQMEVYAGFIGHTDYELGRLIRTVQEAPDADNTLIFYIVGDNGTSAEAGLDGDGWGGLSAEDQLQRLDELGSHKVPMNHYSAGWAWLGSTPFQWWKSVASHFGGVRDPLIVSWPKRIRDTGGLRSQFTHVNDVAATIYDVAGIPFPETFDGSEQRPLDGVSFAHTFDRSDGLSRHRTQYFEMFGNRAIYHEGWVAAAAHEVRGWEWGSPHPNLDYASDKWELYNVENDFSEAHDLAALYPEKLQELKTLFDIEARKNDVYPLGAIFAFLGQQPPLTKGKTEYVYYAGTPRLQWPAHPNFVRRSYRITAQAVIPDSGAEGVIVSYGERGSGFVLYVKDNRLIYRTRARRYRAHEMIASDTLIPRGEVYLTCEFTRQREAESTEVGKRKPHAGLGRLMINGQVVGQADITEVSTCNFGCLGIGQVFGSPVSDEFEVPFKFTGILKYVKFELI